MSCCILYNIVIFTFVIQPCCFSLSNFLFDLISLIFTGTVIPMLEAVLDVVPVDKLAVHFHDTYGQALSNNLISLQVNDIFFFFFKDFFMLVFYWDS